MWGPSRAQGPGRGTEGEEGTRSMDPQEQEGHEHVSGAWRSRGLPRRRKDQAELRR